MSKGNLAVGAALLSFAAVVRVLAQFLALPIMAHLLDPADYGIVSIAMPFVFFAQIFSDGGVGQSMIREDVGNHRVWSSAFWLMICIGIGIALALCALSPLIGLIYHNSNLAIIICVLALMCVVQALLVVPAAALQREKRFHALAIADFSSAVGGASCGIFLASHHFGSWSLVGQQLAFWGARMAVIWFFTSFRPRFVFDLHCLKDHLHFSRDIVSFNLINFFARSFDPLVIGKAVSVAASATYNIGYQCMRMPAMVLTWPVNTIIYTEIARNRSGRDGLRKLLLLVTAAMAGLIFPTMGMLAAAHAFIFPLLFSAKWAQTGQVFALLATVGAVQAVTGMNGAFLQAVGRTEVQIRFTAEFAAIWVICLLVSSRFGFQYIPIAYSISWFLYYPRFANMYLSPIGCSVIEYTKQMVFPAIVTALSVAVYYGIFQKDYFGAFAHSGIIFLLALLATSINLGVLVIRNRWVLEHVLAH